MLNLLKKLFKQQPKPRSRGISVSKIEKDKMYMHEHQLSQFNMINDMNDFLIKYVDVRDLAENYKECGIAYVFGDSLLQEVIIEDRL